VLKKAHILEKQLEIDQVQQRQMISESIIEMDKVGKCMGCVEMEVYG